MGGPSLFVNLYRMRFEIKSQLAPDSAEILIVPCMKGQNLPAELLPPGIAPGRLAQDFTADWKETQAYYLSSRKIILLGLGENPGFAQILNAARSLVYKQRAKLPASAGLYLLHWPSDVGFARALEAAINGALLGRYLSGLYKTEDNKPAPFQSPEVCLQIFLPENQIAGAEAIAKRAQQVAATQMGIFDLVNKPSNEVKPQTLAQWAENSGQRHGYSVRTLDKAALQAEGFHALLAVNRGSADPAVCIIMDYAPKDQKPLAHVCLVGKGVTFDTGGLSIKPSQSMHLMKSDMGGAAAVLGAVELAAKFRLPLRVTGVVPSTDNSVDAHSLQPSEVISSYSGKTIEIIDTDAEGRLILADALSYAARNLQPDVLIDLATLTGATVRALGSVAASLFANDDQLSQALIRAGEACGERLWPFPLWDEFKDGLKSDIADVKNLSSKPTAGAIYAAKFLEVFIENHPRWAHLDIAGVALTDSEFASHKSATAYGVRLLLEYLESLTDKK